MAKHISPIDVLLPQTQLEEMIGLLEDFRDNLGALPSNYRLAHVDPLKTADHVDKVLIALKRTLLSLKYEAAS